MLRQQIRLLVFAFLLFVLPNIQTALLANEQQDIWRVDLHAVPCLTANERHFSKLAFYRWEQNRWQISDAETFFGTQLPEIPLIVFAPGYTLTTLQTTQVGLGIVRAFDPSKPCRVVFWTWFSDRGPCNIRRDVRNKFPIADNAGDYLALFLEKINPESKVCLFGFSLGSRIVCQAVETLRKSDRRPEGLRLNLVLSGAATNQDWFVHGGRFSRIPEIVEKVLVTYNSRDWVLRFYPLVYNFRDKAPALGFTGLPTQRIPTEFRSQFENININRYIGREHQTLLHVQTPAFRSRINTYFLFE